MLLNRWKLLQYTIRVTVTLSPITLLHYAEASYKLKKHILVEAMGVANLSLKQ